jgi:hypothetical protein
MMWRDNARESRAKENIVLDSEDTQLKASRVKIRLVTLSSLSLMHSVPAIQCNCKEEIQQRC